MHTFQRKFSGICRSMEKYSGKKALLLTYFIPAFIVFGHGVFYLFNFAENVKDQKPLAPGVIRTPKGLLKYQWCCLIRSPENPGHALTEIPFETSLCGPVIAIKYREHHSSSHYTNQVAPILNVLGKTNTTQRSCLKYYLKHPDEQPARYPPYAYLLFDSKYYQDNSQYDAFEVGRNLRKAQSLILSSCGMNSPNFTHHIPDTAHLQDDVDGHIYEPNRAPSQSVLILVRDDNRTIRNAADILPICSELNIKCTIIHMNEFWSSPDSKDYCHVLKTFENQLVIGMPGAEMIYPIYVGTRIMLLTSDQGKRRMSKRHYGKPRVDNKKEKEAALNLVIEGQAKVDPFFPEFALHFGADIVTTIYGSLIDPTGKDEDPEKLTRLMNTEHCTNIIKDKPRLHSILPGVLIDYCLDMAVDLNELRTALEEEIAVGNLLQAVQYDAVRKS